jgi:hypothetical protein
VTIQAMIGKPDCELIIGAKTDPDFGPVILFGMGGVLAELLGDNAIALPPLNRLLASRLMEGNTRRSAAQRIPEPSAGRPGTAGSDPDSPGPAGN